MDKELLEREILNKNEGEIINTDGFTKVRIDLDNGVYARYLEVKKELKTRDADYYSISQYLGEMLATIPKEIDSQIIENRTPLEFKIKCLLEKDGNRKKLEKLLSKL